MIFFLSLLPQDIFFFLEILVTNVYFVLKLRILVQKQALFWDYTQQGVRLSKLDALAKLTFGCCILERHQPCMRALNELLHGPLDGGGGSVHGPVRHHRRRSVARQRRRVARRRLGGGFEAPRRESLPCALAKHNEMKMRSPPGPHSYTCLSLSVVVIVAPLPPPPCRAVAGAGASGHCYL